MSDPQQPQMPPYASQPTPPPQAHQPQQTPAQPQPVYAQPAQQGSAYPVYSPSAAASPTDSNPMGKIGLIFGIASLGIQVLLNVMIQIMIRTGSHQVIGNHHVIDILSGVFGVITFLAGVGALVFGIIGIKRVGAPHAVAGIATGLGIAIVVGAGLNFVFNAISMLISY